MNEELLKDLLDQYLTGTITSAGKAELARLIDNPACRPALESLLEQTFIDGTFKGEESPEVRAALQQWLQQEINGRRDSREKLRGKVFRLPPAAAVAASVILLLALGAWFFFFRETTDQQPITRQQPIDINPGTYKARLTLADGRTIVLDSAASGELAKQGNTSVINKDGQIIYNSDPGVNSQGELYNTLSTTYGETYSTVLADGSKVWLNSASSIKFPVAFAGNERRVEITGEAYFEIAKDPAKKFIVSSGNLVTEVFGTHFNINSYEDEAGTKVTLFEGSVRVTESTSHDSRLLKPGQQTQVTANRLSVTNDVNTNEVIAWKEGLFHFESTDLKTILRQFARWYNIEIIYQVPVSNEKFFIIMGRNTTLSNVLKSLQANEIKFRIEGRKLFVQSV